MKMKKADFVFESSYEVCNKVGGIYTVLKTKAPHMVQEYREGYFAIGIFNQGKARIEFEEKQAPDEIKKVFEKLKLSGIECYFGEWIIPGKPKTILVNPNGFAKETNNIKRKLWDWYQVDSLRADNMFVEPVLWSYAVGMLLEELVKVEPFKNGKCVAHFHEWLAGAALLYLKNTKTKMATVFTTHATMIGRTLAGSGLDIYGMMRDKIGRDNITDYARRYGVIDKHTMETACSQAADILTTVSSVTADEVVFFWHRKPEMILLNGIDVGKYMGFEDLTIRRRLNRVQTRDFLTAYFRRYYPIDLMNIRSVFISGRHEFRNKGLDVFIEALSKLNKRLKDEKSEKNVIAFIFVPAGIRGENIEVLKNKSLYEEIKDHVQESLPEIGDTILGKIINGEEPKGIISDEFKQKCKKFSQHFLDNRGRTPPLCAFELDVPEDQNEIIRALKANGLLNRESDKVKVIYYPAYLSTADRLISLDYGDATITCDIGVFPSYYEPWGYTPIETAAQGTLAITTDQAGFGRFIQGKGIGIHVLERMEKPRQDIVNELADKLFEVTELSKDELALRRMNAKRLSMLCDWRSFVKNYVIAHDMAVDKVYSK